MKRKLSIFLVIVLALTISMPSYATEDNGEIKVHFINVGQADSIFIDYGDYDILIDGGNNADGETVVNYLKQLKTDDIEIMVATHPHEDHIGGLDNVLKAFKVETIIDSGQKHTTQTYKDYINAVAAEKKQGAKVILDKDMTFDLGDGISFKVIETGDGFENTNDNSVITLLDHNNIEFLFTGDMEAEIEKKNLSKFIDIDVLKSGHHGSKTSSSIEFLNKIKPEYAVISAGEENKYGHPNIETLKKYKDRGIQVYRTDKQGSIVATTDGNEVTFNNSPVKVEISNIKSNVNKQTTENDTGSMSSNTAAKQKFRI